MIVLALNGEFLHLVADLRLYRQKELMIRVAAALYLRIRPWWFLVVATNSGQFGAPVTTNECWATKWVLSSIASSLGLRRRGPIAVDVYGYSFARERSLAFAFR